VLEAGIGLWGFGLHPMSIFEVPQFTPLKISFTAPRPWRQLLFPNLMILGMMDLWQLRNNQGYVIRDKALAVR